MESIRYPQGIRLWSRSVAFVALLSCASFGLSSRVHAADLAAVPARMACSELLNVDFASSRDLPFRLLSATLVTENVPQPYCDVVGYVPSQVKFQVKLPTQGWTQRFVMSGCGGYCGSFNATLNTLRDSSGCIPAQTGELAIAATDLGHTRSPTKASGFSDGAWAWQSPDAIIDFAYAGMHKATIAAKALIKTFYGRSQAYSYYIGCSDGGREALQEVQRYPTDYDGVIAGAPVIDETAVNTFYHAWNARVNSDANYHPILTTDKIAALNSAVLSACGKLNGGVGDMLQDFRACRFDATSILCPPNSDFASCLTPEQARVANLLWQGPVDREGRYLAQNHLPYGSELAWPGGPVRAAGTPLSSRISSSAANSEDFPSFMATWDSPSNITWQNMNFDATDFRLLTELSGLYDATNPDLSAFAGNGGKLILWAGWYDSGARSLLNYRDAVRQRMGHRATDEFITTFMLPGVYHCNGGPTPASQDFLTPMFQWVEDGIKPAKVVVSYSKSSSEPTTIVKTRPAFPYPDIAVYKGSGDVNDAANFVQAAPQATFADHFEWLGSSHYSPRHQQTCELKRTKRGPRWDCSSRKAHEEQSNVGD
jgi:Tannase and feruloyl esterase